MDVQHDAQAGQGHQGAGQLGDEGGSYTQDEEFCVNDSYILLRDFGEKAACKTMWRLARVASWFLMNRGFSICIGDVTPSSSLLKQKKGLVDSVYEKVCSYFSIVNIS